MMTLVSYDVSTVDAAGRKRLRKVAKECVNYGQRVQNSVFEVDVDYGTFLKLKDRLMKNKIAFDSIIWVIIGREEWSI